MNRLVFLFLFIVFCSSFMCAADNQFYLDGFLKELKYQASISANTAQVLQMVKSLEIGEVSFQEQQLLRNELTELALNCYRKGEREAAEKILQKLTAEKYSDWKTFALLAEIKRSTRGEKYFQLAFLQFKKLFADFEIALFFVLRVIYYAFLALLISIFLFVLFYFLNHFRIIFTDILLDQQRKLIGKKIIPAAVFIIWPLLFFSWGFFPFVIASFCWFYFDRRAKKNLLVIFALLLVFNFLLATKLYLENSYRSDGFRRIVQVFSGKNLLLPPEKSLDSILMTYQAYNLTVAGEYRQAEEIISRVEKPTLLLKHLKGIIALKKGQYEKSISIFRDVLQSGGRDFSTLNNLTLAIVRHGEADVFNSFANAYPEIKALKNSVHEIILPEKERSFLFSRLWTRGNEKFEVFSFLFNWLKDFLQIPLYVGILIFFFYLKALKKVFPAIGSSVFCTKCHKIIKRPPIERPNLMCDDCYQLFLIKDPVFFDAKILKEKELQKMANRKNILYALFGLIFPGVGLILRRRSTLFITVFALFAFFTLLATAGVADFLNSWQSSALIFNLAVIPAVLCYLFLNFFAVWSDSDAT